MSVALDLDSLLAPQPVPSRRPRLRVVPRELAAPARPGAARLASVSVLHAPSAGAAPLRLTRRGIAVLAVVTAAIGIALVWAAAVSARGASAATPTVQGPAVITVHTGDTLWALAGQVAPERDPLAEVADLRRLNHLTDPALTPGQSLRVR